MWAFAIRSVCLDLPRASRSKEARLLRSQETRNRYVELYKRRLERQQQQQQQQQQQGSQASAEEDLQATSDESELAALDSRLTFAHVLMYRSIARKSFEEVRGPLDDLLLLRRAPQGIKGWEECGRTPHGRLLHVISTNPRPSREASLVGNCSEPCRAVEKQILIKRKKRGWKGMCAVRNAVCWVKSWAATGLLFPGGVSKEEKTQ
jgi:hypothetical protein